MGCTRRERHLNLCAYSIPTSRISLLTSNREFYHRTSAQAGNTRRLADAANFLSQHGPPDSPFVGGEYHGVLMFPSEYPFKPPGIKVGRVASVLGPMLTPCACRCTRRLVASNQTRKSAFLCLISTLVLCVLFPSLCRRASLMWIISISINSGILHGVSPQCEIYRSRGAAWHSITTLILTFFLLLFLRLTGLVSFMLSDEMTTGSVTTSNTDKRVYASRSHSWNLQQRRFREAFPEVSILLLLMRVLSPRLVGIASEVHNRWSGNIRSAFPDHCY